MIRKIMCLLGFHEYEERCVRMIGKHGIYEMVCIHCGAIGRYKD